jgi:hypothetical protein
LSLVAGIAYAQDSYDPSTRQLSVASLIVGYATYYDVVVTVSSVVSGPIGMVPNGDADSYDPITRKLSIQSVSIGGRTYNNVVATVGQLISIGTVAGADTYNGASLVFAAVQVDGGSFYTGVVTTIARVINIGGGMPLAGQDTYDASNNQLFIASGTYKGRVYTNVTVALGEVQSLGQTTTSTTLDPSLPAPAASVITQIVTPLGAGVPGANLPVTLNGPSAQSVSVGVDAGGNIIAAAIVNGTQTTLTAASTAHAFVRIALGDLPVPQGYPALDAAIFANPNFPSLVAAVTTAQGLGKRPSQDKTVQQSLLSVLTSLASKGATNKQRLQPQSIATPYINAPLPFTLIADTVFLGASPVTICGNPGAINAIPVCNSMPIPWDASTTDHTGALLQQPTDPSGVVYPLSYAVTGTRTDYPTDDPVGFSITIAQDTNTHIQIMSDIGAGVVKTLLPYLSGGCAVAQFKAGIKAALTGLTMDSSYQEALGLLESSVNPLANPTLYSKCRDLSQTPLTQALISLFGDLATTVAEAKSAYYGVSVYYEALYAANYWSKPPVTFGVCLSNLGAVMTCATKYTFNPGTLEMAPGASVALPVVSAFDAAPPPNNATLVPAGLLYTPDDGSGISVDTVTGTVSAALSPAILGGPFNVSVKDQQLGTQGSFQVTVVNPTVSPASDTAIVPVPGIRGANAIILNLTDGSGNLVSVPTGAYWKTTDSAGVSLQTFAQAAPPYNQVCVGSNTCTWAAPENAIPGLVTIAAYDPNNQFYGSSVILVQAAPVVIGDVTWTDDPSPKPKTTPYECCNYFLFNVPFATQGISIAPDATNASWNLSVSFPNSGNANAYVHFYGAPNISVNSGTPTMGSLGWGASVHTGAQYDPAAIEPYATFTISLNVEQTDPTTGVTTTVTSNVETFNVPLVLCQPEECP